MEEIFPEIATDVKSISDYSGQCLFTSNVCPWGIVRIEMVSIKKNILLAKYKSRNNNLSLLLYNNEYASIIGIYFYEYFHWSQTFSAWASNILDTLSDILVKCIYFSIKNAFFSFN
jgi:hypothetical protein